MALSNIWFDTSNANTLYVASASFTFNASHLWKSTNQGQSWTALDGGGSGFPAGPVHVIQNDPTNPSTLLAGTDYGAFISTNGGTTWTRYGQGLPMVAVRDLYIAPDGKFIRAATFGRGVWEIGDSSEPVTGGTTQLLLNPGFELGNNGAWVESNNNIITSTPPSQAHAGSFYGWMGDYPNPLTDSLYQQVAIPANASSTSLNFWMKIANNANPPGMATNILTVKVRNSAGADLATLATFSNLDAGASYVQRGPYNLSAYAGQTIQIYLSSVQPGTFQTSFFVDDFELNATTVSATAPTITTQPLSQTVTVGQSTTFAVAASGTPTLTYQWRRNGSNINGATSATYTFTATLADSAAQYSVLVSNGAGSATSSNATLTVNPKSRDLNGDGQINVLDITTLMAAYSGSGVPTSNPAADLDGDGDCDDADLALLLAGI